MVCNIKVFIVHSNTLLIYLIKMFSKPEKNMFNILHGINLF